MYFISTFIKSLSMGLGLFIILSPLQSLAKVSVQANELSTSQIEKELIYPQYSDAELLEKEFELRNQLVKLKKRKKQITGPGLRLTGAIPGIAVGTALFCLVDQNTPFHQSSIRLFGLVVATAGTIIVPTSLYQISKVQKQREKLYKQTELQHKMTLKAIDQRNTIAAMKNAKIDEQANASHQTKIKILKRKEYKPLSYLKRAWIGLGLSAIIMAKGYHDYQEDPDQSETPLYVGLSLGAGVALGSAYLFMRAYEEKQAPQKDQNLEQDDDIIVNTWFAPSLIDRDWGLSYGFQF